MNCTGKRCLAQYNKVDPATCTAVPYCPQATPPKTNADRIRSMTDAELARWLNKMQGYAFNCGLLESMIRDYPNRLEKWVAWLKEEVKDED